MATSDATLIELKGTSLRAKRSDRGQEGSEQAELIERLFEQYRLPLRSYLTGLLRQPEDAEDIVQETYMLLMNADNIDPTHSRLRSYIFRVATNLAYDRFRQRQVRGVEVQPRESELINNEPGPDQIVEFGQAMTEIKQVIETLKPRCRQVFLLRSSKHLSFAEIAKRLGTSKRTVEREMQHALEVCKKRLRGRRER